MQHTNVIAIVMVALLTLSACAVAGVTTSTKAAAAMATKTTLFVGDHGMADVGGTYHVQGVVTTSTGLAVSYGDVALYRQLPGETALKFWKSVSVVGIKGAGSTLPYGRPGSFSTTDVQTKPCTVTYKAYYLGWPAEGAQAGSQYAKSESPAVHMVAKYDTTMSPISVTVGAVSSTLWYLPSYTPGAPKKWVGLKNQYVNVYKWDIKAERWTHISTGKTDALGKWTAPSGLHTTDELLRARYVIEYKGDATHWGWSNFPK